MTVLELAITVFLYAYTIVMSVVFYTGHGRYNKWLSWTPVVLVGPVFLARGLVSPLTFAAWLLAYSWLLFLVVTNVFLRCSTEADFLSAYRRRLALIGSFLLFAWYSLSAAADPKAERVLAAVVAFTLWLSFRRFLRCPRGQTRPFWRFFAVQVFLLFALTVAEARNELWDVVSTDGGLVGTNSFIKDNHFNTAAFEAVSANVIAKYCPLLVWAYWYLSLGLLYHGLLPDRARAAGLRSFAVVLLLVFWNAVPESRQVIQTLPFLGRYLCSPTVLLGAFLTSTLLLLGPIVRKQLSAS